MRTSFLHSDWLIIIYTELSAFFWHSSEHHPRFRLSVKSGDDDAEDLDVADTEDSEDAADFIEVEKGIDDCCWIADWTLGKVVHISPHGPERWESLGDDEVAAEDEKDSDGKDIVFFAAG